MKTKAIYPKLIILSICLFVLFVCSGCSPTLEIPIDISNYITQTTNDNSTDPNNYDNSYVENNFIESNNRSDYPILTDEEFADFRKLDNYQNTYRSASLNNESRAPYIKQAINKYNIKCHSMTPRRRLMRKTL